MGKKTETDPEGRPPTPASFTEVILDSVADGVFTVDEEWRITSFNRAAEEILGISREFAIGNTCHGIFRSNICETDCALRQTLETGQNISGRAIYVVRPDGRSVPISISTAVLRDEQGRVSGGVETFRDLSAMDGRREELTEESSFHDIVSRNHRIRKIFSLLPDIARNDSTVLITGPSGTGKELIARAIHDLSPRCDGPLVTINCAALPDTLLESELFGYRKGAFTDAHKDHPGKFAQAEGGTVFLDEIGDVSPAMQARLLRVLQERVYEPLGDTRSYDADVRIVAATNKDLPALMAAGKFREDLFYRLSVMEIALPDLASRRDDVPLLADHFLHRLRRQRNKDIAGIADEAMAILLRYDFPGNVRELKNIIEHAFVLCPGGMILPEHLPERLVEGAGERSGERPPAPVPSRAASGARLVTMEARTIAEALRRNGYRRSATALELGISKTTLWRKIKKYGIDVPG